MSNRLTWKQIKEEQALRKLAKALRQMRPAIIAQHKRCVQETEDSFGEARSILTHTRHPHDLADLFRLPDGSQSVVMTYPREDEGKGVRIVTECLTYIAPDVEEEPGAKHSRDMATLRIRI